MSFPEELRELVDPETWTYAKTMPRWPHDYLVRERVSDEGLFRPADRAHPRRRLRGHLLPKADHLLRRGRSDLLDHGCAGGGDHHH